MRKYFLFILLVPLIAINQQFADKDYYLVDSLDLSKVSKSDVKIVDSCLKVYHKELNDTVKLNALVFLTEECSDLNVWPKYNLFIHDFCKSKYNTLTFSDYYNNKRAESLNNLGYFYKQKGEIKKALTYYHESLKLFTELKNKSGIATTLNNIGIIYFHQGNIKKGLNYYHQVLTIQKELGNKKGTASTLNNIATIYKSQDNFEKALDYYFQSLSIFKKIENNRGIAGMLNNIGSSYKSLGNIEKALKYFYLALKKYKLIGDKRGIATSLSNLGSIFKQKKDLSKALDCYHESLKIVKAIEDKKVMIASLNNLSFIYYDLGEINKAKQYLSQVLELSIELGYPNEISNSSETISILAAKEKNYKEAYEMYTLHIKMRDSINNIETQKVAIEQEAKYQYETQKKLDDAEAEKLIAIEKEAKEKQKVITTSTIGGLVLLGLFLAFVFNRLQKSKKQQKIIFTQKQEVEKAHLKTAQQKEIIEETHKEITDSINYAKRLQDAILPSASEINAQLVNNFILFEPKDVVSGDFYWFEHTTIDNRSIRFLAAADCTGHGVPGAMVSVVCSNALNRALNEFGITSPAKILDKTRELVVETFAKSGEGVKDGMDIALCAFEEDHIIFAGANNPLWIVRNKTKLTAAQLEHRSTVIEGKKALIEFKADKQPIGLYSRMAAFTETTIPLEKGDSLYFFTDGFADQFGGEKGKKFKYRPFKKLLLENYSKSMEEQKVLLSTHFKKWRGELEQVDDVCIIGIKLN